MVRLGVGQINVIQMISEGKFAIEDSETTLRNGFDIKLEGYDYTIGKIIEFMLYDSYYIRGGHCPAVSGSGIAPLRE